jgi:hypothetical protein
MIRRSSVALNMTPVTEENLCFPGGNEGGGRREFTRQSESFPVVLAAGWRCSVPPRAFNIFNLC